jgi:hypothetical protein
MNAEEIHRELCAVYGQNVMSEGTVRQWLWMFEDGRTMFTMNSEVVGRPSVVSGDLDQSVDQKFGKYGFSKFQDIPKLSRILLYGIITGSAITSFAQNAFRECSRVGTKRREWLWL